jgi:hypothetical protein
MEATNHTDSIGRLQLFIRDEAVRKGLIQIGHYGIPESDEKVIDLGVSVDVIPLARRPKAIDTTDSENVVVSYDFESDEFKGIAAKSAESGLRCQYGPAFLVFERSTGRFLEFFCGTKSSRIEAKNLFPLLPLTQADIDAKRAVGYDVSGLTPHGPIPATLKVNVAENRRGTWHVPVAAACSSPFDTLPDTSVVAEKTANFLNVGREWLLDRMGREENRKTKPEARRQMTASTTPAKDEWTSTRKARQAAVQADEPLAETHEDAKPAEGNRERKLAKGKNRKGTPSPYPTDRHEEVANDGELTAATSASSIWELLEEVDSVAERLQVIREKLARLVRPAGESKRRPSRTSGEG